MAVPGIRVYGTIKGGDEVVRRFVTSKDRIREAAKREMRQIGRDFAQLARSYAPKHKDYQSPASRAYGPLAKSIKPSTVKSGDRANILISVRPQVFYGLFVEAGYTKQEWRRGNRNADGTYGAARHVMVANRRWTGASYSGQMMYSGPVEYTKSGKVKKSSRNKPYEATGASMGVKYTNRALTKYTFKKTYHIAGRQFMSRARMEFEPQVPGRLNLAVMKVLNAGA